MFSMALLSIIHSIIYRYINPKTSIKFILNIIPSQLSSSRTVQIFLKGIMILLLNTFIFLEA